MENIDIIVEDRVFEVTVDGGRGPRGEGIGTQPLRYKAILAQSGTNNPIPYVIENTISSDLEWEFLAASNYRLKSLSNPTGLFTLGKTFFYAATSIEGHTFNINHSTLSGTPNNSYAMLICSNIKPIGSFTYLSILIEIYP